MRGGVVLYDHATPFGRGGGSAAALRAEARVCGRCYLSDKVM